MSYIDSFDHEYVGQLGYLPIYHPLETLEQVKWGDYDFGADPTNLILGGGSGEHPGLVLHRLECFVAKFLFDQITEDDEQLMSHEDRDFVIDLAFVNYIELLEFCEWRISEIANFHKMAKSSTMGYRLTKNDIMEDWLIKSIGELVYYALPELNPEHESLTRIFQDYEIHPVMRNVLIPPPGYPAWGGRQTLDNKSVWGHHRFYDSTNQ
ncbi:hypothetical protein [Roseivirga sp.]|uniref:hypothetical protein n=1 Tax=Roseivirga sp. TaxID=1964215 RepID=UPI003B529C15